MISCFKLLGLTVVAALAVPSQAAPIAIVNADFEDGGPVGGGFPQVSGWGGEARNTSHASFRNESALFGGGDNFVFNTGDDPASEQTLVATYIADTVYTLAANINYGGTDVFVDALLELGYDNGGGFVSLGSTTIDMGAMNTTNGGNAADGTGWALGTADGVEVLAGNAAIGEQIIIRIAAVAAIQGLWFDTVTLDGSPVPEPGSLALLCLGGLLIARRRRG